MLAIPVQMAWPFARACRIACAGLNRADRCSPTVGMTCGWRRPDSRIEAVASRWMTLALPAMLESLGMLGVALLAIAMLGVGLLLAQSDHR